MTAGKRRSVSAADSPILTARYRQPLPLDDQPEGSPPGQARSGRRPGRGLVRSPRHGGSGRGSCHGRGQVRPNLAAGTRIDRCRAAHATGLCGRGAHLAVEDAA